MNSHELNHSTTFKEFDMLNTNIGHIGHIETSSAVASVTAAQKPKKQPRLTYTGGLFHAHNVFDMRDELKKQGWRWSPDTSSWVTSDPTVAEGQRSIMDLATQLHLDKLLEGRLAQIQMSAAGHATIQVPAPVGLEYHPFQLAGIAYMLGRPGTLLGDEMGLGKTIQLIGLANADPSIKKILIICPASLKLNWAREFATWDVHGRTIAIVRNGKDGLPDADVIIINYELVGKLKNEIQAISWDLVACDEAHYLKNWKSGRTKSILGDGKQIPAIAGKRQVFITGTPILNRPIELWPIVKALDPRGLGASWNKFVYRYCAAEANRYCVDVSGASNLAELQEKLRAACMVRRMKKDVLTELPPKVRQVVVFEPNAATKTAMKAEAEVLKSRENALLQAAADRELAKCLNDEAFKAAVRDLRSFSPSLLADITKARLGVALAKIPETIDHIEGLLESTDKIIVMAHHHEVIDKLKAHFGNSAVVIDGSTDPEDRQAAVDRFQGDPTVKVFIGSIHAAGVGITLTAASTVVFIELDWTPGWMVQAEDRAHRIGQKNSVLIQHLVVDGSIDAKLSKMLVAKQRIADAALNLGSTDEDADIPLLPTSTPAATFSLTRKQVHLAAGKFNEYEIDLCRTELAMLRARASLSEIDGMIVAGLLAEDDFGARHAVLGNTLLKAYQQA